MFDVVKMTMAPEGGAVIPGGRLVLALVLQNASAIVDRYEVTVAGVPAEWVTLDKTVVSLFPGQSERVMVTLAPPAGVATAAGAYPVTLTATSADDPTARVERVATLTVGAVGQLAMELLPPDTEGRTGTFRVTLTNGSNRDETVALRARDNEEGLRFALEPEEPVRVPAGGERVIVVQATPKTRETVGEPHPYDIEFKGVVEGVDESDPMAAAMAALLVRQGRYTYHPRFSALTMPRWVRRLPMWALILLLLLLLLLLSLAGNAAAAALGKPGAPHRQTHTPLASVAHPTRPAAATTVPARATMTAQPRSTKAAATVVAGAAPRINRFAVQVGRDGSMALAWDVAHAGTVLINGQRVGASGLRILRLTKATTFVLTVIGPGGASTQEIQVIPGTGAPIGLPVSQVTRSLPTIEQFTAGTDRASGGLALTWTVSGATRVTLNGMPVGAVSSKRIALGDHTTYVLRATNSQGTIVETITLPQQAPRETVTRVVLHVPTIPRFALTHDNATDAYTLVWNTHGATGVTLNGSTVAANGSYTPPLPLQNGTYVLVASNQDGATTARVDVVVQQVAPSARVYTIAAPRIVVFALRRINGKLYIVWQVSGATRVTLQGKSVPASGQMEVPAGTTLASIRLTATSDAGNAQQELLLPHPLVAAPSTATPRPTETATTIPSVVTSTATSIPVATDTTPPTATTRPLPSATTAPRASATNTPRPTGTPTDTRRPTGTATSTASHHVIALPPSTATYTPTSRPTATRTARPVARPNTPPASATASPPTLPASATATATPRATASPTFTPIPAAGSFGANPTSVTFGNVLVGANAVRTVTLTNGGPGVLVITKALISGSNAGDYTITTNGCLDVALAPGASCAISLTFAPAASGSRVATLTIDDNAPGGPHSVSLNGAGINPIATFGPTSLDFGSQYIPDPELGVRTITRIVALTNTGTTPLVINSVTVAGINQGDYTLSSTCGASLAPGAACVISVVFSPAAIGDRNASVTVTDNAVAGGGTQTVPLHGAGINPQGQLYPSTVDFGAVAVGQSRTLPVTLTNTGTTALSISRVTIHGLPMTPFTLHAQAIAAPALFDDFSADTSACPETVAPGASCVIAVTFRPTHVDLFGPRTDLLEIDDNTQFNGGQQLESLIGQGLNQSPTFTPPSLQFGAVPTGVTITQLLTVTNPGSVDLHISAIYVDGPAAGDFGLSTSANSGLPACSTSTPLGPGASCVIAVSFTPSVIGTRTATLHLSDDAAGSPQQIQLGGAGTDSRVAFNPSSLSFDHDPYASNLQPLAVSDTVTQTITLSSAGTTPLTVGTITLNDPHALGYTESDNCQNRTIPAGQTCTITVTLTPVSSTNNIPDAAASLRITDDSRDGSAQTITLSATTARPTTYFGGTNDTGDVTFTNTLAGTSSATQTVSLNNYPSEGPYEPELLIPTNAVTLSGPNAADFTINTDGCSGSPGGLRRIDPGSGCDVAVSFTPQPGATGTVSATLTYNDNASNAPQTVTLYGTVATRIRIRPSIVDTFYPCGYQGDYSVTPCETRVVTVTNTGPTTLTVTSVTDQDGNFNVDSSGCTSAAIPVGGTCAINVTLNDQTVYANGQPISGTDSLIITSNGIDTIGHNSPQVVPLEWSDIAVSPHGLDFGSVPIGTGSVTQTVTINDINNFSGVTIISATIVGVSPDDNPGDFAIVPGGDGCSGQTLQADGAQPSSCQITVVFTPTASGPRRADLLISDTDTPLPHDVTLDGVGAGLGGRLSPSAHDYGVATVADPTTLSESTYTLIAAGVQPLQVYSATVVGPNAGDFPKTADGCESVTRNPGQTCQVTVAFSPTVDGPLSATLLVYDNAPDSPQAASLTGSGQRPYASFDSGATTFGPTLPGQMSATQPFTLTNYGHYSGGPVTLVIPSNAVSIGGVGAGAFHIDSDGCSGQKIVGQYSGANCIVGVSFRPPVGSSGTITSTLTITDNAQDAPQQLTLSGVVATPDARAQFGPSTLSFDNPPVSVSDTVTRTITLTSTGTTPLHVGAVTLADPTGLGYGESDNCAGRTLDPGATCVITVTLTPTRAATSTVSDGSTVQISDDSVAGPDNVALTATTGRPSALFDTFGEPVSSGTVDFGNATVGMSSTARSVGLLNNPVVCDPNGCVSLSYVLILPPGAVTLGGADPADFTINSDGCSGQRIDPDNDCNVMVSFTPQPGATGPVSATLTFNDNAALNQYDNPARPQTVILSGTVYPTRVEVRPGIMDLHSITSCPTDSCVTSSTVATTTVTNLGPGVLGPVTPTISDANDFQVSGNDCSSGGITVGGSCVISVTLTTTGTAGAPDTTMSTFLQLDDNALGHSVLDSGEGNPQYVNMQRTPVIVAPQAANFGAVAEGAGVTQTFTMGAQPGTGPYTVTNVSIVGDDPQDYRIVNDQCTGNSVVSPAGTFPTSCTVTVGFTPTQTLTRSAELLIGDTISPFGQHDITLTGFGIASSARVAYLASLVAQQPSVPNPTLPASIKTPAATSTPPASAVSPMALTTPTPTTTDSPTPTTTDSSIAMSATPMVATATATVSPIPIGIATPTATAIAMVIPTAIATPTPTATASPPGLVVRT